MPHQYMIHALCDECAIPHPTGLVMWTDESVDPSRPVAELYDGREEPKEFGVVRSRRFQCPETGHTFGATDNRALFLVGVDTPVLADVSA